MADLIVKSEEIIDGVKLDDNSIGYFNYKTLANKPKSDVTLTKAGWFADSEIVGEKFDLIFDDNDTHSKENPDVKDEFINKIINKNPIRSVNYDGPLSGNGYSTKGVFVDLKEGFIHTPGLYTTNSKAYIRGDITATNLTLNDGVTIPASKIDTLHKVATSGNYEDLNNRPVVLELDHAYGNLTDKELPGISVTSDGKLTANNADLSGIFAGTFNGKANISSGNIGGVTINEDGKLIIPADQITGLVTPTKLTGEKGEIDLNAGTFNFGLNNFVFNNDPINSDGGAFFIIRPTGEEAVSAWMDNTNTLYFKKEVDNDYYQSSISTTTLGFLTDTDSSSYSINKISFTNNNTTCSIVFDGKNIKLDSPLFLDHYERAQSETNRIWRRPIASVGSDGLNIGYMKAKTSSGGTKQVAIKGQWGKEDVNGAPISNQGVWDSGLQYINIDSTSDIRLKENIKDSTISALPVIMDMKVREFDWKETKVHQPLGLVADEIEELDPLLTIGGGYESDGSINIKSIDRLLLTEYAIKAIQEQQNIINKQQKEINTLKQALNIK